MGNDEQEQMSMREQATTDCLSVGDAREATGVRHKMSLWESIKTYPRAAGWSMFFSLGTIMTAFDPQLLGNLYATPAFQRDFGYLFNGSYIISAPWQTALGMGNPMGQGTVLALLPLSLSDQVILQWSAPFLRRILWTGTEESALLLYASS
jgi:hypothetical protein